jgi:hypothetical protein
LQTGFIQRKKVLNAFHFLTLMTVGQLGMKHPSLAGMVDAIKVKMSREGMHRRFSVYAVSFMERCCSFILKQKISKITSIRSELLKRFKRILIFDSSSWAVRAGLRKVLPGSGGAASDAGCKLQACYEYKRGELRFFEIMSGITPDNGYAHQLLQYVQRGDLLLIDLGYFSTKTFHRICEIGAFFLSRLFIGTGLFDPKTSMSIDLLDVLKRVKGDIYEMQVIMGEERGAHQANIN